jgi:hypothetical protein
MASPQQFASNTGSQLLGPNGANITSTALSTNIIIKVGPNAVGAVQSMEVREDREIRMIDEIGQDGHIDSVPVRSTNYSGTCERIRFERMRIAEAFSRSFLHAKSQRYPFDIVIFDIQNGNGNNALITTIKNVWIQEISYGYRADNWIITDRMTWQAEDIFTVVNGNNPGAQGGTLNIPLAIGSPTSDIEVASDVGSRRGSLDVPGLINAILPY